MPRYRIPTHLTVEPSLVRAEFGPIPVDLTFRQAAILACAAGFGYWLWQGSGLPPWLVVSAALVSLTAALVAAFVTVGGRSADLWLHDALYYLARPRLLVWRAEDGPSAGKAAGVSAGPPLVVAWRLPDPAAGAAD